MSRRDFLRALDRFGQLHSMEFQRGPKQYSRCVRQFSSTNEHNQGNKEGKCGETCTKEDKYNQQQQEQEHYNHHHHHGRSTRRELQRQREADFVREFNDIHNHFFGNLPLRRYVHFDNFSALDRIFNQEFNRIRKDLFEKENAEEHNNNHQETAKESNQSTIQTSQATGTAASGADKKPSDVKNQGKQTESSNQDLQRHHQHQQDPLLDLNSFFESPRYISDVGNIFRREQQRLQELTKEFENSFRNQENNPGARTIRRVYRSNPEGEYREFYDSKNPESNYKFERKFDKSTGQSTITRTRGDQLLGKESQQQQNTSEQHNANAQKAATANETTVNHQKNNNNNHTDTVKQTNQADTTSSTQQPQQQASKPETMQGTIAIPPELNDKAKKLSIMLKKDYLECLELAKVYQTKSVGQIIDLVLEIENTK